MIGPLSGFQDINNINKVTNLNSLGNSANNYGNINQLNDFMGQGDISGVNNGSNKIDFSKIDDEDIELKADLQGLVQKNQIFDGNSDFGQSEITTGEVADKFSNVLGNYLNNVNEKNRAAEKAVETFASGGNIDMHSVMIASEKASLSLQLAAQMKNKILQAYQEISRIQV